MCGGGGDLISLFFYLRRKIPFENVARKAVGFCFKFSKYLNWLGALK